MKRYLLLLFFSLAFVLPVLWAQSFTYEPEVLDTTFEVTEGDPNVEIVCKGFVTNLRSSTTDYMWYREEMYLSEGWFSAVCDKNACYFEHVDSAFFELGPDEKAIMDLHLRPKGLEGDSAVIRLSVMVAGDPSTAVTYEYTARSDQHSSIEPVAPEDAVVSINPNPVHNSFSVHSDQATGLIEVYNVIGTKQKTFNSRVQSTFNIADLSSGMYLVRVYDKSNTGILSTVRLQKK